MATKNEDFFWSVILAWFCKKWLVKCILKNSRRGWVCKEMAQKLGLNCSVICLKNGHKKNWYVQEGDFVKKWAPKAAEGWAYFIKCS